MKKYVRVLTANTEIITLAEIKELLDEKIIIEVSEGKNDLWGCMTMLLADGTPVCTLERIEVISGNLGDEQIKKLLSDIDKAKPESAVSWLKEYLSEVRCVYAFELLAGVDSEEGFASYNALKSVVWSIVGGIIQEDNQGFTNEDGHYILRQFSKDVKGQGYMAVLDANGEWINFQMDLEDEGQRKEFCEGRVPAGAEVFS